MRRGGGAIRQRVRAVPGARIEAWEADGDGFYDVQYPDGRTAACTHPFTDGQGRYRFWAFTPTPYPIVFSREAWQAFARELKALASWLVYFVTLYRPAAGRYWPSSQRPGSMSLRASAGPHDPGA